MTDVVAGSRDEQKEKLIRFNRIWTTPGTHPYDQVTWERRDAVMTDWRDGSVTFEQRGVEFPSFWSLNATNIVVTRYFRGKPNTSERETSLRQIIDRVVTAYVTAGVNYGYFATDEDAEIFGQELTYMLLHQIFSFNSPVWFNVGTPAPQQVSACFILSVDDSMESILDWYKEEGLIFKGGSGSGVNLSRIRGSNELLSSGGTASGPVSFMRGADASAGTIKSGGATRRAAKMVILDVDHPDIEEFIDTKAREEDKIRVLRDAGFDMDLGGRDILTVQYQNANNSVRVTDAFMHAVENNLPFDLRNRLDDSVAATVNAKELFRKMAQAAWGCADPGIQYDGSIQYWHTNPNTGRITASNPCSEYMSLDNSSCNLASLNLMKFRQFDGSFDRERFVAAVRFIITAMDISVSFADFPTEKIAKTTRAYRQLGIGYANLGALLMSNGIAYDSDEGRAVAAAITSLMTATSYHQSTLLAAAVGAYQGYARNASAHNAVMRKHAEASMNNVPPYTDASPIIDYANSMWSEAIRIGDRHGYRNAQVSLLAPTGTIGLMMDCDTTGIEPDLALVKFKKLFGGGSMKIVNQTVPLALLTLGYGEDQIKEISDYVLEHGHVINAPSLDPKHYPVFDCAMGERSIAPMGHVNMMAAVQPFLSGAISKTINMPESATVEDVEHVYMQGWKLGLKALAIYRDNCKVGQPLSVVKKVEEAVDIADVAIDQRPQRQRLPKKRNGHTVSFAVGGAEGYMTASSYPDGGLGEIFLKMSKQGSTLAGVMDAFSIAISVGLQYGVPLETYIKKFINMRFDPAGWTDDPDIRTSASIVDYMFRRLALDFLPADVRADLGILTVKERAAQILNETVSEAYPAADTVEEEKGFSSVLGKAIYAETGTDAPLCMDCGVKMQRAGSCYLCSSCGRTSGCS